MKRLNEGKVKEKKLGMFIKYQKTLSKANI